MARLLNKVKRAHILLFVPKLVEKMDMMISLVTTYMAIESESMKELKELQEEIIHAQAYIQKRKFEETQR
ncbi:hypothetical protein MKX66_29840 [Bacillus sp. FSL R9-9530]|uniref:hypothetical protein n=1 Tax=Bacillus sp. FSL R9-9530 TaxID=2921593 RepID=UPI0030FCAE71